jgi:hypothetical protein
MTIERQFKELIPKNLIKNTQIFSTDSRLELNPALKLQYGTRLNAWQQKSVSHKFPFGPDLFGQCSETDIICCGSGFGKALVTAPVPVPGPDII